ncbi:MAG: acyl carrier protein [Burkholderiales bacterium]|nr:acyl carrier protein [Burkholderiales bacterium]
MKSISEGIMDSLKSEVAKLVEQTCKVPPIGPNDYSKLLKAMGIDSLDAASLFLAVMERYAVEVPDEQIEHLNSIDSIAAYIEARRT